MYYVYVLKKINSKSLYIGYTNSLKRRLIEHKKDRWENYYFIYCEVYVDEADARKREQRLKNYGAGLGHLRNRLQNTLENGN